MSRRDMFHMEHGHDPLLEHQISALKSVENALGLDYHKREQFIREQTGLDVAAVLQQVEPLTQHPEAAKHAPKTVSWVNGLRSKYETRYSG